MDAIERSQREIVEALLNSTIPKYLNAKDIDVAFLRLALPLIVKEVETAAFETFQVPKSVFDDCVRNMYGTMRVRGQPVFPGL